MLKLLWMADPVQGVFSVKFISPCHIDADIRLISTESSPDFSSTVAEGDGRPPRFSQQETGPAKQVADHLNWESSPIRGLTAFPKRTFHRHKVIPQDGDKAVFVPILVRPTFFKGFGGTWRIGQRCIEDGSPSINETHGMDGYSLAILCHLHSHLSRSAFFLSH
jgi:hypothetical protein